MKQSYIYLKDALQDEYKSAFEKVEVYGSTHLISGDFMEERLMELLDNMLSAQKDQKPVAAIIGRNIDTFCQNFYGDYKLEERIKHFPKYLTGIAWVLFIFSLIEFVINFSDGILMSTTMGGMTAGIIGGCVINLILYFFIRPLYLKSGNAKLVNRFLNVFYIISLIIIFIVGVSISKQSAIQIPVLCEVIVSGAYLAIYYAINCVINKRRYGTLFAPKTEGISFEHAVSISSMYTLPDTWLKAFCKKNEKLEKKGKTNISEEEYLNRIAKNVNYKTNHIINIIIFGGIGLCAVISTAISNGPEMLVDSMVFALIIFVLEGLIYRFFDKISKRTYYVFHEMRKRMKEEQLSLSEYVAKIHGR